MSLNDIPSAERVHISFFGRRNAGKSSLVNAVTGQQLSVVSNVAGTTTDPVNKSMELLPIGPVVIIDTPGYDDVGGLGELRVIKTREILGRTDIAVLAVDMQMGFGVCETELIGFFEEKNIPYVIVYTKNDLEGEEDMDVTSGEADGELHDMERVKGMLEGKAKKLKSLSGQISVSAKTGENIYELKELIGGIAKKEEKEKYIIRDLIEPGDSVILVIPVDESAPKGRIILPQQQVLREILDMGALAYVVQPGQLDAAIKNMKEPPALVVTDSQVFKKVDEIVPESIRLTSFSILLARYKGFLDAALKGVEALDTLKEGDRVLISEACTHHRQCEDIGTVKIPKMLDTYTGTHIEFGVTSGKEFPDDLGDYRMVIHCGGCMVNEREMLTRMNTALDAGLPFTNYGIFIAHVNGILKRSVDALRR